MPKSALGTTLCVSCVAVADADMLQRRIANHGVPKNEDTHWAATYNDVHKSHQKQMGRIGKK